VKPSQRVRYAQSIEKVVTHLSASLRTGEIPDLARLADVAALSPYHFHRIFRLMTGETPIAMVRRLRVAAGQAMAGYSSSQSFARARSRAPRTTDSGGGTPPPIAIEVVSVEPFVVTALRNVGDYTELNRGYARLFELLPDPNAIICLYGIPYDDPETTPPAECEFDCCMKLTPGAEPKTGDARQITVAGGRYAKAHQVGSYDQCWETLDRLYIAIIDELDAEIDATPPFIHYYDDPDTKSAAELSADLYVRIVWTRA
jgi:AraC family transcriptional regulator